MTSAGDLFLHQDGYSIIYGGFWLVVWTPLKNMKVNWDDEIPNIWENIKCSKPPTRLYMVVSWNGGTPSHHPFVDGIFHEINHPASELGDPPWLWKSPCISYHTDPIKCHQRFSTELLNCQVDPHEIPFKISKPKTHVTSEKKQIQSKSKSPRFFSKSSWGLQPWFAMKFVGEKLVRWTPCWS